MWTEKYRLLGHATRAGYRHEVWAWPGYGVVCPTLVTTNGSARLLAQCIDSYVPSVAAEPAPDVDLAEHLIAAYRTALREGDKEGT